MALKKSSRPIYFEETNYSQNAGYPSQIDSNDEFDISDYTHVRSTPSTKSMSENGILSIVNSPKGGRRIILSKHLLNRIGNPSEVQIMLGEGSIVVASRLGSDNIFPLKQQKEKGTIFSSALVKEIAEGLELDFSNRVSITFQYAEYHYYRNIPVAVIFKNPRNGSYADGRNVENY